SSLDAGADSRAEVGGGLQVVHARDQAALLAYGAERLMAARAAGQVLAQGRLLYLGQVTGQRCADQLVGMLARAQHRHRTSPSVARWRRISPRARHRRVRTAP